MEDKIKNLPEIDQNTLNFSIQFFASSNYPEIMEKYNFYMKKKSLYINDLFIVLMKHNLGSGIDYLLVYKNFENRGEALNYCEKYLHFIENCLIVNVQNLE